MLLQYPATNGMIIDYRRIVQQAHAAEDFTVRWPPICWPSRC